MSAGDETLTPTARRLGPRALASIGVVLCLVVGGILASVFRGGGPKGPAPVARENAERPNEPRFLERQPGLEADRFTAEIQEQERRRSQLREALAARTQPSPAASSPFFMNGSPRGELPAEAGRPEAALAAIPAGDAESAPPPGVYRPYPVRPGRSYPAVPPPEGSGRSVLARALQAPILLGAPKDEPADASAPGVRARLPLTPPSLPDLRALLPQLQAGSGSA